MGVEMTDSKELLARLTTAFVEASPLEKWELLALNGLLGTDEPWIENMRDALKAQEAHIAALDARIEALEGALHQVVHCVTLDGAHEVAANAIAALGGEHGG